MKAPDLTARTWLAIAAILVVFGLLLADYYVEQQDAVLHRAKEEAAVRTQLALLQSRIEGQVRGNVLLVRGLVSVIADRPAITQAEFERAARPLFAGRSLLRNIGAAPDMVLRLMYPLAGNEKAIGVDLRSVPAQRAAAEQARDTGALVLAGPLQLLQGGTGLIGRLPVFIDDAGAGRRFWGLLSVVIDMDPLYRESGLLDPGLPIEVAIRGRNGTGEAGEVFYGNPALFGGRAEHMMIPLPYGSWQMAARPAGGWTTSGHGVPIRLGFLLAAAFILGPMAMVAWGVRQRVAAEEASRRASAYARSLLEAGLDPLVTISPEGTITDVNRATEAVTGRPRAELVGSDFSSYFTDPERARAGYRAVFSEGSVVDLPLAIRHASGRITEVLYNATVYRNESGEVAGVFAAARDITERQKIEAQMRDGEARLRMAMASARLGLFEVNLGTGAVYVSAEVEALMGHEPGTCRPTLEQWMQGIHPDDRDAVARAYQDMLGSKEMAEAVYRCAHCSGRWIWLHSLAKITERSADGAPLRLAGIHMDITERRHTEIELEAYRQHLEHLVEARTAELQVAKQAAESANAAKSVFLTNMSHELRTPMHAVLSFARLGEEKTAGGQADAEAMARYFSRIQVAGERLLRLLNDLLDLAKLEAGKVSYAFAEADLRPVLRDCVEELGLLAARRRITLRIVPPAVGTVAWCDPARVGQVVHNLISNALKYTPEGRSVEVLLADDVLGAGADAVLQRPALRVTVRDEGVGIPAAEIETVFEKFVQSSATHSGAGGTGLGLAICREIITQHGGRIWAVNNPEGGTSVSFLLPRQSS